MTHTEPDDGRFGVANENTRFGTADKSQFADETAKLLRNRLTAVATVLSVVIAAAFVGNFYVGNYDLLVGRAIILIVLIISAVILRGRTDLGLGQLRFFELIIFGAIGAQVSLMMCLRR